MIFFTFPNNTVFYCCENCVSSCCNVNNYLVLGEKSHNEIKAKYPNISDNFLSNDKKLLRCARKCWFLNKDGCTLQNKPLTCHLYPLDIIVINNLYTMVNYIPCPKFEINYQKKGGINHQEELITINNYITLMENNLKKMNLDISIKRIEKEQEIKEQFYNQFFQDFYNRQDDYAKLIFLYPQIRWQKKAIRIPISLENKVFYLYEKISKQVDLKFKTLDLYNKYILVTKIFIDRVDEISFLTIEGR